MKRAAPLAGTFTVYVPDRRGRELSGLHGDHYGIATEMHYDAQLTQDMEVPLARFAAMRTAVLLLGSKSRDYLKGAVDALSTVWPQAPRIGFRGMGHLAAG